MKDDSLKEYFSVQDWMFIEPRKGADLRKMSPNEINVIDECVQKFGELSYDEIKEKSHDVAWRSTARDYPISIENIAREGGVHEDELEYIKQTLQVEKMYN